MCRIAEFAFLRVRKLLGGCSLIVVVKALSCHVRGRCEFVLKPIERFGLGADDEWCEELRGLIGRAVKRV